MIRALRFFFAVVCAMAVACSDPDPDPGSSAPPSEPLAAEAPAGEARPNVILVSLDTLRADRTSPYGYERDTSPGLASFAEEGARFETAYAHTATTGPSHATMLTSRLPIGHGVDRNGVRLPKRVPVLTEVLGGEGYETAAFVSTWVLDEKWGFNRGFETYDSTTRIPVGDREANACAKSKVERCADQTIDRVLTWLDDERDPERPFFLFVHLFDVHTPYDPPEAFLRRYLPEGAKKARGLARFSQMTDKYDAEVAYTDHELSRLFEALDRRGLAENSLVIVTADHGEALGSHHVVTHGVVLYEPVLRVPFLARFPGRIAPGLRVEEPVGLVDLMPTVLELLGVDPGELRMEGRSLAGVLRGDEDLDPEHPIFLQRRRYETEKVAGRRVKGAAFGLRQGRWKFVETEATGQRELYDLVADPGETNNLVEAEPEQAAAMAERIASWKTSSARGAGSPQPRKIRESDRRKLRALGYVD